jgi:GNAT superfamily N-acetyltransferase
MTAITVTGICDEHLPDVVACIVAQQLRQAARDTRLRPARSPQQVEALLVERRTHGARGLVALDANGCVRGCAWPDVWKLAQESSLHAFLSARNGIVSDLALPAPGAPDAQVAANALLAALSEHWQAVGTPGDLIRWPSADPWIEPALLAHGFRLDSVCALRERPLTGRSPRASGLPIWPARVTDEERLVALFEEELRAHEPYTPFVHSSPAVLSAFRGKLARLWEGSRLEDGAPLVLVAGRDGEIVAMIQARLVEIAPDDEPGFTPPGLYGCIDNLSVREMWRGQGIGRALVQAAFDAFAATGLPLSGWLLWYNPDNPLAAAFWQRLGFVALWTTYQRRHDDLHYLPSGMSS